MNHVRDTKIFKSEMPCSIVFQHKRKVNILLVKCFKQVNNLFFLFFIYNAVDHPIDSIRKKGSEISGKDKQT